MTKRQKLEKEMNEWMNECSFYEPFSSRAWVSRYVSILDYIGAKDDGGGEWWQLEL